MNSFKELIVWQKSRRLAFEVYQLTKKFPKEEIYGLTSQLRRCSVSVPANIAEGYGRQSNGSFSQFLKIAKGSLYEMEAELILACDFEYISNEELKVLESKIEEI